MRPTLWLPPVLWMAVILALGSDGGSAEQTGRFIRPILQFLFPGASPLQIDAMHGVVRKLAHLVEYAILAALWFRAFAGRGLPSLGAAWRAFAIAAAWAIVDESYQATLRSRGGSPVDVLVDAAGALAAAVPAGYGWRPTVDRVTRALLWVAALGGVALLALDLLVGAASGWLWVTAPAALVALALLRRRAPPTP